MPDEAPRIKLTVAHVSDCEGFEQVLFRTRKHWLTWNWDLIIELHGAVDKSLPLLSRPSRTSITETLKTPGHMTSSAHVHSTSLYLNQRLQPGNLWCMQAVAQLRAAKKRQTSGTLPLAPSEKNRYSKHQNATSR